MSIDKRTVHTDALDTLGSIIDETARRDAIHVAVEPVVAAHDLAPGSDVGFVGSEVGKCATPVGIVDPFLKQWVKKGQRFWLLVYPRKITSLRHVWEHPEFQVSDHAAKVEEITRVMDVLQPADGGAAMRTKSEAWLRDFCANNDAPSYVTALAAALRHSDDEDAGEYLHIGGEDASGDIPPEFWDHVRNVTGVEAPPEKRAKSFSCSC